MAENRVGTNGDALLPRPRWAVVRQVVHTSMVAAEKGTRGW